MKKNLKQLTFLALIAAAAAFSAAGCGSKSSNETTAAQTAAESNAGREFTAPAQASSEAAGDTSKAAAADDSSAKAAEAGDADAAADASAEAGSADAASSEEAGKPVKNIHAQIKKEFLMDYDTDPYRQYVSMDICSISLTDEDAAAYPELAAALDKYSNDIVESDKKAFEQYCTDAREQYAESGDTEGHYSDETNLDVVRADSNVFSVRLGNYSYIGGAHGYYYNDGVTFDSRTGKKLGLTDIISDIDALKSVLKEQLLANYDPVMFFDLDGYFNDFNTEAACWSLNSTGIDFYFNPYEIAPYASGQQMVTLTYAEHPELFNEKYTETADSFVIPFINGFTPVKYDVRGDGTLNAIRIEGKKPEQEDAYDYNGYTVYIDDRSFDLGYDDYFFEYTPYLLHTADGNDYIYIIFNSMDDYHYIDVIDITGGNAVVSGNDIGGSLCSTWTRNEATGEEWTTVDCFTDPDSFRLCTYISVLSTYGTYKQYRVGADGIPVSDDKYYTCIMKDFSITLKKNFTAEEVDESGNTIGSVDLKEGDKITFYRSDNRNFADLLTSDGRIVRVTMDFGSDSWGRTMEGEDIYELFDGLMFAG